LNEFAQGIEHLRIKISFDYIKKIFNYLDADKDGLIKFDEFRLLDEENFNKIDPLERLFHNTNAEGPHEHHDQSELPAFLQHKHKDHEEHS